ncbi:MAG: FkbM family methyltransferase [Nitrosomonadales bacterium]|nr:FkbM family methyltransferase [Nitrosomonadales bacterium]
MRPIILRLAPQRARQSIASRFYLGQYDKWRNLFEVAPLAFCPHTSMYNLVPGDIISGHIAFNGFYELDLSREIARLSRNGNLFVDVGANMGYFSLLWAGMNTRGRVIAFEAAPRCIKLIEHNIVQNGLADRITLVAKAAGHLAGTSHFNTGPTEQTGWGGISNDVSADSVEVQVVRLDEELPDTTIDVLKIDVEGADTWVLYGCEKLLRQRRIHKIFFEQNNARMAELGIGANEAGDFLASVGYACIPFGRGGDEWVAYPNSAQKAHQDKGAQ